MMRTLLAWMLVFLAFLAGCGGGGGDSGTSPFPTDSATLSSLEISLSGETLVNDGSASIVATVTAKNSSNKILSNVPVLVSADTASVTVTSSVTDSTGVLLATVGLGSSTAERTVTVTASSGSLKTSKTFKVVSGSSSSSAVSSLRVTLDSDVVLPGSTVVATVQAVNSSNQLVSGVPVVLTSDSPLVTITAISNSTDSSGKLSAQISIPSTFTGLPKDVLITAVESGSGIKGQKILQVVDKSAAEQKVASLRIELSAGAVANGSGATVTATVTAVDSNDVVVAGAPVVISTSGVGGAAGGVVTTTNPYTSTVGTMTSVIGYGSITDPRTIQVTATSNGKLATKTFNVIAGSVGGSPTLTLKMSSDTVSATNPPTVTALLLDEKGLPIPGQVITLASKRSLAVFSASTLLTDSSGLRSAIVYPYSNSTSGADEIVGTVTINGTVVTGTIGFQVTSSTVSIASFTSDISSLAAYSQANLEVTLNTVTGTPVGLSINSLCLSKGKAQILPTTQTITGSVASFSYKDAGCGATDAEDKITVTLVGTTSTMPYSLKLGSPAASSLGFVSATPEIIYLKSSGFVEESQVKFIVKDQSGNALPNRDVLLSLTTLAGGLKINGGSVEVTQRSDANGEVTVRINAGTVPTPVRVLAKLKDDQTVSTVSSNLSVRVGLPSQLNFSLSQQTHNIEGMDYDGTANTYSIIASDRQGNPVPAGTTINFISTEGGQVGASSQIALTSSGLARASSSFISSAPRPVDGRITVVAYAIGEESFLDLNGNNKWDAGEPYQDLGDLFVSRMYRSGTGSDVQAAPYYSAWDQYFSLSLTSPTSCPSDPDNPTDLTGLLGFNETIPSVTALSDTNCRGHDNKWGRAYVRRAIETVLSRSTANFLWARKATSSSSGIPLQGDGLMDSGCYTLSKTNQALALDGTETVLTGGVIDSSKTIAALLASSNTALNAKVTTHYQIGAGPSHDLAREQIGSSGTSGTIYFLVADSNPLRFNPMPSGTTITVTATPGITVAISSGSPVVSTTEVTQAALSYKFTDASSATVTLTATTPNGVQSSAAFVLTQAAPTSSCTK